MRKPKNAKAHPQVSRNQFRDTKKLTVRVKKVKS